MKKRAYRLTVGSSRCDIEGFTNAHIQAAVDRCALLGGGTVELCRGVFRMADSLHLRTGVSVRGQRPSKTRASIPSRLATCRSSAVQSP